MCITKINFLGNGDYEILPMRPHLTSNNTNKSKKHEICLEPLSERDILEVCHVHHTNQTVGKRGILKSTKAPPFNLN